MKKTLFFSLLAVGFLTGCHSMDRTPYTGGLGEYGFTYDLNAAPTPFHDNSYRPLTPHELAAPIIIIVTNQPPISGVYETAPELGDAENPGHSSTRTMVVISSPQIEEAAGAETVVASDIESGVANAKAVAPGRNFANEPGDAVILPNGATVFTNNIPPNNVLTNRVPQNGIPTNVVSPNSPAFPTNRVPTNSFNRPNQFNPQPRQNPAQIPGQTPAQVPSQIPAQVPSSIPAQVPNSIPAQVPGQIPPQTPAANPPAGTPAPIQPSTP